MTCSRLHSTVIVTLPTVVLSRGLLLSLSVALTFLPLTLLSLPSSPLPLPLTFLPLPSSPLPLTFLPLPWPLTLLPLPSSPLPAARASICLKMSAVLSSTDSRLGVVARANCR